jgi:hypothetical protein
LPVAADEVIEMTSPFPDWHEAAVPAIGPFF